MAKRGSQRESPSQIDREDLYAKLAVVLALFHGDPDRWVGIMRFAIALNASFNTHRMLREYAATADL